MGVKTEWTRQEMQHYVMDSLGRDHEMCGLCGEKDDTHADDCPFHDRGVTRVTLHSVTREVQNECDVMLICANCHAVPEVCPVKIFGPVFKTTEEGDRWKVRNCSRFASEYRRITDGD